MRSFIFGIHFENRNLFTDWLAVENPVVNFYCQVHAIRVSIRLPHGLVAAHSVQDGPAFEIDSNGIVCTMLELVFLVGQQGSDGFMGREQHGDWRERLISAQLARVYDHVVKYWTRKEVSGFVNEVAQVVCRINLNICLFLAASDILSSGISVVLAGLQDSAPTEGRLRDSGPMTEGGTAPTPST
jgi:hypothetical protein